jgi:hypothetical protein
MKPQIEKWTVFTLWLYRRALFSLLYYIYINKNLYINIIYE